MAQALDLGITTFDHADIYGGYSIEALFGEAFARTPGLRQKLQIVTKCGIKLLHPARPGARPEELRQRPRACAGLGATTACAPCAPTTSTCC